MFEFTALSISVLIWMSCSDRTRESNLVKINLYENFSLVETFLIQRDHLTEGLLGRNIKSRIFVDFNDLDLNQIFCCFNRRFCNQKFLRISVPIKSGDLGFGFVSIEDFETYIGGTQRSFQDDSLLPWMESIGSYIGDQLYFEKEDEVTIALERYILQWNATGGFISQDFRLLQ